MDVRRLCVAPRLRLLPADRMSSSLAMTVAAISWIADHELPHRPEKVLVAFREDFVAEAPPSLVKEVVGLDVTFRRADDAAPAVGDAFREAVLEAFLLRPLSLPSVA